MRRIDSTPHEAIARPVVAIGNDYPPSCELAPHCHGRDQFLYAAKGVLAVSTAEGAWVAPPERGIWIPAGVSHAVRMVGTVSTRSVLIVPGLCPEPGRQCRVLAVSDLLRSLLVTADSLEPDYDPEGRDGLVMTLLLWELRRAPVVPLSVPFPSTAALAERCRAFLERPDPHATIDQWSADLGLGRKTFTRLFRKETGMSFAQWRQQACLLVALPRLANGDPVTTIALDLGYDSPASFATMFKRLLGIPPSRYSRWPSMRTKLP
ncbi:MAG: helix-turn-helix transcriptional regulator [Telmatospirillum sp.]|nr:helix-turn-helix transcriptional regulator [Telmatospirillum sp.]